MSKKKKSRLNKMLKAQQLQQISAGQVLPVSPTTPAPMAVMTIAANPVVRPADRHLSREILRTLISLLVVAALLFTAVIVDRRTNLFTTFGAWLFQALRLANK
ncbi:MAG TPA: hypothetical protein VLE93_03820 [Candidatus Saccharimonadales bacterium]|nr:hypothetical protein [Candidatus Saccharimonadales bacterium]